MFKHIICTLFAKNGVLYRANGYINFGIFTCKVCQKDQLLSKTSVASQCPGRESKQQLSAYTWRQTLQYTCTYAIFSSKIRINLALRCYMQMYQWTLILRVSFGSSQSTCMPCVLQKHEKCIKSHFHAVYKMMDINVKSHANVSYVVSVSGLSKMAISRS